MVISPFLSELTAKRDSALLDFLLEKRSAVAENVLVSRPDQLDALKPESIAELQATTKIYILDDAAVSAEQAAEGADDKPVERPIDSLSGLHAKVYVIENGANVSILGGFRERNERSLGQRWRVDQRGVRSRAHRRTEERRHRRTAWRSHRCGSWGGRGCSEC